jgi:hypothetical protein
MVRQTGGIIKFNQTKNGAELWLRLNIAWLHAEGRRGY